MGEVSELNYCLKEGVTCIFLAREQACPAWGRGVLSELAMHSPFPFPIKNDRSISFIEQGKQCLYITSKLKV